MDEDIRFSGPESLRLHGEKDDAGLNGWLRKAGPGVPDAVQGYIAETA